MNRTYMDFTTMFSCYLMNELNRSSSSINIEKVSEYISNTIQSYYESLNIELEFLTKENKYGELRQYITLIFESTSIIEDAIQNGCLNKS